MHQATDILAALYEVYDPTSPLPSDVESAVSKALTDLRHICDLHNLSFADIDRIAYKVYSLEAKEVRQGATTSKPGTRKSKPSPRKSASAQALTPNSHCATHSES